MPTRSGADTVTWLTFYLVTLYVIPAHLVIGPLGGAGAPATLVGAVSLVLWGLLHLRRSAPLPGVRTARVRRAAGLFAASVMVSYAFAMLRPIESAEAQLATLALISLASWLGTTLLVNDLGAGPDRVAVLVDRLALVGGLVAILGIVQFVTNRSWVDQVQIPGLVVNGSDLATFTRDAFTRPSGTAVHPIEFGVVVTMLLPFALYRGMHGRGSVLRRWWPALAIAAVVPLSLSRSALIGALVVFVLMLPTWPRALRRIALVGGAALVAVVFVAVPGLIGTLTGLFTGISDDSSAASRTDAYDIAFQFISRSPFFGRGLGTFLPKYRILDNQLLLLTIEIGVVGVLAFLALLAAAVVAMLRLRRRTASGPLRDLAMSVIASVVVGTVTSAMFDSFAFPQAVGTLFLVLGLAGALVRVCDDAPPIQPPSTLGSRAPGMVSSSG